MTHNTNLPSAPTVRRNPLGLPTLGLIGLAAIGLPRVILHDLHLIDEAGPLTWLLALGPVAVWVAVAVLKRVPNPFLTVLVIGAIFGVMLVIIHQILWETAFAGNPPALGSGTLATLVPRLAAIPSGLFTGAIIGAIGGLIAWGIQAITKRVTH